MLFEPYVRFHSFSWVWVTEWTPIGKIAAQSAYAMFSRNKYPIVNLVFFPPRILEWKSFFDRAFS